MTSRLPGFHRLTLNERVQQIAVLRLLSAEEILALRSDSGLGNSRADLMVENAVGTVSLPIGIATNFLINGQDYLVPMAIEEPSVVAAASNVAKLVRGVGGFQAEASSRLMIGQIQITHCTDPSAVRSKILSHREELLHVANQSQAKMVARGGGAREIDVRVLETDDIGRDKKGMLVVQVTIDTRNAMGANVIDTMMETLAPRIAKISGCTINLSILSNYTDQCLASAQCQIPISLLGTPHMSGEEVGHRIVDAYRFAELDLYRAVTHNKGIMNGIDAVALATGNDWRAIEAAAHAYAAREGLYRPLSRWEFDGKMLKGFLTLPLAAGIVGGAININPTSGVALKILGVSEAQELTMIMVSVGLAQNLGALRSLVTDGLQKGHMALHARARSAFR